MSPRASYVHKSLESCLGPLRPRSTATIQISSSQARDCLENIVHHRSSDDAAPSKDKDLVDWLAVVRDTEVPDRADESVAAVLQYLLLIIDKTDAEAGSVC